VDQHLLGGFVLDFNFQVGSDILYQNHGYKN